MGHVNPKIEYSAAITVQRTKGLYVKSFDSRVYSINDFVEWEAANGLSLNAAFQRRPVWSPKAKSYLIDTILRGKPIPKIFIRQIINPTTKTSIREVVDGQQRLRSILSYVKDGFTVSKRHNPTYGGMLFSELEPEMQTQILSFELSVDLLVNLPNSEILDIFGRLNSYAVILNDQEKINADHFGPFKILADDIGRRYNEYWTKQKILTERNILRMLEISLVADLLIAMLNGIKSKKQIKRYYANYEKEFEYDTELYSERFNRVIETIGKLFPDGIADTYFRRINLFYSLFLAVNHALYGLPTYDEVRPSLVTLADIGRAKIGLDHIEEVMDQSDLQELTEVEREFRKDTRLATTDEVVRKRRTKYLLNLMA